MTINQLFSASMVMGCSLSVAARVFNVPQDVLVDAVAFRMNTAVDKKIDDYQESIVECFKRLEAAN